MKKFKISFSDSRSDVFITAQNYIVDTSGNVTFFRYSFPRFSTDAGPIQQKAEKFSVFSIRGTVPWITIIEVVEPSE